MADSFEWVSPTVGHFHNGATEVMIVDTGNSKVNFPSLSTLQIGGKDLVVPVTALNHYLLCMDIADLSAEAVYYIVCPYAGKITKLWSVIDGTVSTADVTITSAIGVTGITGGVITIAYSGSAAGDVDNATPSAANTITAGAAINLTVTGGGAGGSPRGHVVIEVTPT